MKFSVNECKEIEKEFNKIRNQIGSIVLSKIDGTVSKDLFDKLDVELSKVEQKYGIIDNNLSLYFVKHNYYLLKTYQYFETNPTESFKLFFESLKYLSKI